MDCIGFPFVPSGVEDNGPQFVQHGIYWFLLLVGWTPAAQGKWVLAELLNVRADNGVVPGGVG